MRLARDDWDERQDHGLSAGEADLHVLMVTGIGVPFFDVPVSRVGYLFRMRGSNVRGLKVVVDDLRAALRGGDIRCLCGFVPGLGSGTWSGG